MMEYIFSKSDLVVITLEIDWVGSKFCQLQYCDNRSYK